PLYQSPFEQARRIGNHPRKNRWAIYSDAVDDPLIPPGRKRGDGARAPAGAVHGSVNNVCIEPRRRFARAHGAEANLANLAASGESVVVGLVHKPLVIEQ